MARILPMIIVVSVIVLSGVVDGFWSDRWTASEELTAAAARLARVPMMVGDWEGSSLGEIDPRALAITEASGHVWRRYVNRRTGGIVTLLILSGRAGPLSVHLPETCYVGAGFEEAGERKKYREPGPPLGEFWVYRFQKREAAVPEQLRVFCSWAAAGAWRAADSPRMEFARLPFLYKMYIVRQLSSADEPLTDDAAVEFIRVLLPELERSLLSPG
jgi:Protein of unknown function (DUF3485)